MSISNDKKEKQTTKPKGKMKLDWRGALEDMKDQYSSVELQHKIQEWRSE
ncbi:MAG: DUF2281 domain-containing protein [Methanotrichaceae archaeon]